jgi:hypothetical protein
MFFFREINNLSFFDSFIIIIILYLVFLDKIDIYRYKRANKSINMFEPD